MDRAVAPVIGVALLLRDYSAGGVRRRDWWALMLDTPDEPTSAAVTLSVDADTDRFTFTHRGGDTLDVSRFSLRSRSTGRHCRANCGPLLRRDGLRERADRAVQQRRRHALARRGDRRVQGRLDELADHRRGDQLTVRIVRTEQTVVVVRSRAG